MRQATLAFRDMRQRVERQIEQRTAMLAGVSHDLRTILTTDAGKERRVRKVNSLPPRCPLDAGEVEDVHAPVGADDREPALHRGELDVRHRRLQVGLVARRLRLLGPKQLLTLRPKSADRSPACRRPMGLLSECSSE